MIFSKQKRIFLLGLFILFSSVNLFSQNLRKSNESELSLFNEANSAYYTGFYPGAVDKADYLMNKYPESVFIIPASIIKGESFVYLGRYGQAVEVFTHIIPAIHLGDENYERAFFFLGKALFYEKKYDEAVKAFYECCRTSISQNHFKYYDQSMLFAARSLFILQDYEKAVPVMEYFLENKSKLTSDEYNEILQKLMICYNNVAAYSKNIDLYASFDSSDFSNEIFSRLKLQAAFSYEGIENLVTAYENYCDIIASGIKDLAIISLKRAYLITTKNSFVDSSELFEITKKSFGSTSIVSEFWVRLGIDSYLVKDYAAAEIYFNSAKENDPAEFQCVINLYEQKIKLQKSAVPETSEEKRMLSEITNNILSIEESVLKSDFEGIQDVYYSSLIQCYSLTQNWDEIINLYGKCKKDDTKNLYQYALALYNKSNFEKVDELLENHTEIRLLNLHAKNAIAAGNYKKAKDRYKRLIDLLNKQTSAAFQNDFFVEDFMETLPPGNSVDFVKNEYCKVLYQLEDYANCLKVCEEIKQIVDAKYIAGLCAVKLNRWEDSILWFEDYLQSIKTEKNQFYYVAVYYLGYSYYITGSFENAYKNFVKYNDEINPSEELKKYYASQAYELAAKSALQLRKYPVAAEQGEKLIKSLKDTSKKQAAVLFTAEIYADGNNYKSAIALLKPWTEENNEFASECLYKSAQIYQRSGNLNLAEDCYEKIVSNYGKTIIAEDSLFSCGEMFYSAGKFEKAEDKFGRYIYKYVEGKFAENALFFSADCNFRLKKYERCVMLNNRLCQKFTKSTYLYSAYKNLLEANYILENYQDALAAAKVLSANFELQAKNDGIEKRIIELEKIIAGLDTSAAKVFSEFEQRGGIRTVAGRHAGTELVQLYILDEGTKSEGIILALQLLPLEQGNLEEEVADAAINADLIADWYRSKGASKDAAQYYLLAAEYYRSGGDAGEQKPASALYSATEAFVAEGMMGDARETANLLKALYPKTKYADVVDKLIY